MSDRDTQYSASESKRGLERRIECEKIAAVQEFIDRVLSNLRAVGLPTDDCDGDEAPETILSGWIIANTLYASHRISDLEHRIDLLRATHETDKATLLRLAKAARNAMHYHGLCVALEDEIDNYILALEAKNAAIQRRNEWLKEAREQADLYKGLADEMRRFESIRNGDLVTALEACMEALSQADDSGVVIPLLEDAMKRAEHARSGTCYKCGGCRMKPLPKFADACNCEGGGGGGFVDLPTAEEKYNAELADESRREGATDAR